MVQTDPRFMDVFSVLTGIDMGKMNEEAQKAEEKRAEEKKKKEKEEAEKKKKEEEERKKKEEEDKWNAMSEEEKKEFNDHKKADEIKLKGNEQYKIIRYKHIPGAPRDWLDEILSEVIGEDWRDYDDE